MQKPNIELILMPTMACNMACEYCYVLEKNVSRMDMQLAKSVIEQIMSHNSPSVPTHIYWHGAEPLLAGIGFYREVCGWTHEKYGIDAVQHHIQTNGTLLNNEWFDLFIQEHITVGVSLDGTEGIHDSYRKTQGGKGTFDLVFNNIMAARQRRLYFDVLCVIARRTLGHEDELFDFFYENSIEFGFEPIVVDKQCKDQSLAISPQEYAKSAIHLFDRWFFQSEPRLKTILPLYDFSMAVMRGGNYRCTFSPSCGLHYLAVAPDGKVYPCVRFGGEEEFVLGNFLNDSLEQILASKTRVEFLKKRADRLSVCQKCKWKTICNSGCPHNAFSAFGTISERDLFCEAYQTIFNHVSERVKDMLDKPISERAGIGVRHPIAP